MALKLFRKKRAKELNYLELTPVCSYEHEITDEGLVNVLVPKFTDKILGRWLQPRLRNKYIKANLDEFGSATWLLMDGSRKVDVIARELDDKFGEKIAPVYERLTKFLSQLYIYDFITFKEYKKGNKNG